MDVDSCMRAVVRATNQYCNNSLQESHQIHLQGHLDILMGLAAQGKCVGLFQQDEMLATDCLVALTDVLNNSCTNSNLAEKVLTLLSHLVKDEEVRKVLHSTFNVTACLANLLKSNELSHAMTSECVKLMQQITYKCHISYHETYIEDLLWWLIKKIKTSDHEFTQPCLGLLANLCRENFSVQMSIKNMDGFRSFCKSLVGKLSQADHSVAVFSLSILASLCLNDEFGAVVFRSENVHQTFQLMFKIVTGKTNTSRRYVVDLFGDLLKDRKIQNTLVNFKGLGPALENILKLLSSSNPDVVAKLLELLLLFCRVNGLRGKVCRVVVQAIQSPDQDPLHLVIQWAAQSLDTHQMAPLLALDFVREMYEEAIDLNVLKSFGQATVQVIPLVIEIFKQENHAIGHQRKVERALRLLLVLCNDESLCRDICQVINKELCAGIVEDQMNHNRITSTSQVPTFNQDAREIQADIVFYCLQLMVKLKLTNSAMSNALRSLLQDSRLVPFLSFGIKSSKMERVHMSLKLMAIALQLDSFPLAILADNISVSNSDAGHKRKHMDRTGNGDADRAEDRVWKLPNQAANHSGSDSLSSSVNSSEQDASLQNLINRMQNALEIKDVKTSEILNVYEHRLQSLQTKENHLQDLLDAKTLALSQADRVISQYRGRCAQVSAENTKLCGLLREYESHNEENRDKLSALEVEKVQMQQEVDQMEQDNKRLEDIAEEYDDLMQKFAEQTTRLENAQRSLTTLKQEHHSLTEMHEMLRRHNETLKTQNDAASQQIIKLEEKLQTTSSQLKEKEQKVYELKNALKKSEDNLTATSKEKDELEVALDTLRETLGKTEGELKHMKHEINTLKILCRQHEETIQEKESVIRNQKSTLDKQAHIKNVIQGLFSGDLSELGLGK